MFYYKMCINYNDKFSEKKKKKKGSTYEASNCNRGIAGIPNPSKVWILVVVERRWSLILTTN